MPIVVDRAGFTPFLSQISYQSNGDDYEKHVGHLVTNGFANSEVYWRHFIVPATNRMNGYPASPSEDFRLRTSIDHTIIDISMLHYSLFFNLFYAHNHILERQISFVENTYTHLGSSCDLAEAFLEKIYMLLLRCRGEETFAFQRMTREQFVELAGNWYDRYYNGLFEHYLSKGKSRPVPIPSRNPDILREFFAYLGRDALWKEYFDFSRVIREFRNVVVHDVYVVRAIRSDGSEFYIPRPSLIQQYRSWREFFTGVRDVERIQRDFVPATSQALSDAQGLEDILNRIWAVIIEQMELEFYHPERGALRSLYDIELV